MSEETFDNIGELKSQLEALLIEHRDLDEAISELTQAGQKDELMIRRLKKRKLVLKDRITVLERVLDPDEPA